MYFVGEMLTVQRKTRFKTAPLFDQQNLNVDTANGVIKDVAICTVGEAEGHGVHLDQSFIEDVVKLGNEYSQGLKTRFGHPSLSKEALGTYLGRFKNFKVAGKKAVADQYLDVVAKKSPGGDLYSWCIEMAQKNPDQFGASIVFDDNGYYQLLNNEKVILQCNGWGEPIPEDPDQPVYITIKSLDGADLVDEPAANEGLFSSSKFNADKFAVRLSEFLDNNPDIWQFIDKNPKKFKPFLEKYNAYKSKQKSKVMTTKKPKTFFQKLAAAFQNEGDTAFAQIDAVTDDGKNIRIDAAGDAPAVGDALYIVDTTTDETTVAPDGDYTIAGGDFDGYKCTVVNGVISAVFNPNKPDVTVQQSAIKNYKELQAENKKTKDQLTAMQKKFNDLQQEFETFKKKPLANHTNVIPDDDIQENNGDMDKQFYDQPWNKKARKKQTA